MHTAAIKKKISVVVPCYNEEKTVNEVYDRLIRLFDNELSVYDFEIIYVDDYSSDDTRTKIEALCRRDQRVKAVFNARNFGFHRNVFQAYQYASGDCAFMMFGDLQDPPEVIAELVKAWENGADIAYGKRMKREGETFFKKFTAFCYYRFLRAMSAHPIPLDTGEFRLLDRKVADVFLRMREHNRFLRGMSGWMGFTAVPVEYVRHERYAGETKYTLKKMLKLAFDGIISFSDRPLTLIGWLGGAIAGLSLLGLIALIVCAATVGCAPWLWAVCGLALLNGIVMIALGVQGAYMNRIYDEAKGRPLYILAESINLEKEREAQ